MKTLRHIYHFHQQDHIPQFRQLCLGIHISNVSIMYSSKRSSNDFCTLNQTSDCDNPLVADHNRSTRLPGGEKPLCNRINMYIFKKQRNGHFQLKQ
jgi:hypothetical protein